ncbi:hypothetical protein [Kitasatospora humi]|nr:hypothetical protein [Kitasatospora humi]
MHVATTAVSKPVVGAPPELGGEADDRAGPWWWPWQSIGLAGVSA